MLLHHTTVRMFSCGHSFLLVCSCASVGKDFLCIDSKDLILPDNLIVCYFKSLKYIYGLIMVFF